MNAYFKEYFDYKTLAICIALLVIGLSSIYSATFDINNAYNFHKQLMWAITGLIIMLTVAVIPIRTIQRMAFASYLILLVVLVIVLVIGSRVKGSKSWFGVGGMGGQPSEFAKITTVLAFAAYLSKPNISIANGKHLIIAVIIFAVPMVLVLAQPDLGTMLVFFGTALPLLYWAGASNFVLIAIIVPIMIAAGALLGTISFLLAIAAGGVLLFKFRKNYFAIATVFGLAIIIGLSVQLVYEHMPVYQQKRISTFLNPESDLLGAGYNVVQSKIAIGSGGFFGKGYLHGTQTQLNYIPEQWTDFIFCVPGEEFGFFGSSILIALYLSLLIHGLHVAGMVRNRFGSLAIIGLLGIFTVHICENVGMSMGLMPVIGIPLPFLSYGGSSLVAAMIIGGLMMNFYAHRKEY
jgi:rod shape determining protein RodA